MKISQTQKNLLFNILSFGCNIAVGLYYTPYLVNSLGVEAYGILPLALLINYFVSVLTGSLTSSLTRFYSIALQQKNFLEASKSLSTSLIAVLGFVVFLVPFVVLLIYKLDVFFNIPEFLTGQARLLFVFTIISFFVSLLSSVFNITSYANNRLDYLNIIKIERNFLKLSITVLLFELLGCDLYKVGLANLSTELFVLITSLFFHFKLSIKKVSISLHLFSNASLFAIGGMTFWTIIHQVGDLAMYRLDNFIVNKFWGTTVSGILGAITEFGTYITTILLVITSLFGPVILIAFAKKKHDEVKRLSLCNALIAGVLSAIICGLVMANSSLILRLWLNESFVEYSDWLEIKLISLPFFLSAGVLAFSNRAWNLVKGPAIFTVLLGLINVLLMIFIALVYKGTITDTVKIILIISGVLVCIQSYVVNSGFFLKSYPECKKNLLFVTFKIAFVFVFTFVIAKVCGYFYSPNNLYLLILYMAVLSCFILFLSYSLLFSKEEKKTLISLVH